MALNTLFGINGIGKDTIAEEIRKLNPNIRVTSMSRIYMYILGISKTCDVREKISEEQYKQLETTPQEIMKELEEDKYRKILEKMSASKEDVIFLGHLVSALRLGEKIEYLTDRKTPRWFININQNLIQLTAPANIISERRKKDDQRKRNLDIAEIIKHQQLCSEEWSRISRENSLITKNMYVIENIDLKRTVEDVKGIIFQRDNINNIRKGEGGEYER